jgi:DNA-binding IclR family transcriptional regulator
MIPNLYMLRNKFEVKEDKETLYITEVLEALSDGNWHNFDDLLRETNMSKEMVLRVVNFFRDFGFVEISNGGEAAKLDKDFLKL